jgi:hypothetical protein
MPTWIKRVCLGTRFCREVFVAANYGITWNCLLLFSLPLGVLTVI